MHRNIAGKLKDRFKKEPAYLRSAAVLAATILCFLGMCAWEWGREVKTNENGQQILERGETGEDRVNAMKVRIGDASEEIDVEVSGRTYTKEELTHAFEQGTKELETEILGGNRSLDEVREDLDLVTELPDLGLTVSWETDNYDVIDTQGNICAEDLPEEGTPVRLTAELRYGEEKVYHEFYIAVYPRKRSPGEARMENLREKVEQADGATATEDYLILPDTVGGRKVEWGYRTQGTAWAVLVLGTGAACMLLVSSGQKKKEDEKKVIRQMQIDYPQIINKFNLYIRSGMTVRRAWFLIAGDYEKKRGKNKRRAYEEMVSAMYQIRSGMPESECYEQFGERCRIPVYRKFGAMLAQNLRKGSGGLADMLEREAKEAFEDRKKLAKKQGEEAGTKLMIPMFLMLIIVFAVVIFPAFFSIQI